MDRGPRSGQPFGDRENGSPVLRAPDSRNVRRKPASTKPERRYPISMPSQMSRNWITPDTQWLSRPIRADATERRCPLIPTPSPMGPLFVSVRSCRYQDAAEAGRWRGLKGQAGEALNKWLLGLGFPSRPFPSWTPFHCATWNRPRMPRSPTAYPLEHWTGSSVARCRPGSGGRRPKPPRRACACWWPAPAGR